VVDKKVVTVTKTVKNWIWNKNFTTWLLSNTIVLF
jgi:hypothetical protein